MSISYLLENTFEMAVYLHSFNTQQDFTEAYDGDGYHEPWVSYTKDESKKVNYNKRLAPSCYVDLGLPSGTLWACSNLGTDNPHEIGNRYAWGEVEANNTPFTLENYKFYDSTTNEYTKYNEADGKTTLENEDDAVKAVYPDWHVPTPEQIDELLENTIITTPMDSNRNYYYLDTDGTNYWLTFKSKINDNELTFAVDYEAYQYCSNHSYNYDGGLNMTWCSEMPPFYDGDASECALALSLACEGSSVYHSVLRNEGSPVRPVLGDGPAPSNGIGEIDNP